MLQKSVLPIEQRAEFDIHSLPVFGDQPVRFPAASALRNVDDWRGR